jgi:hypothetical protein
MSLFHCLDRTNVSVRAQGLLYECFVMMRFYSEELLAPHQPLSWRTSPCQLSMTAYSVYSQRSYWRSIRWLMMCHAMKAQRECIYIMWCILNLLHVMEVFMTWLLCCQERTPLPTEYEPGWILKLSWSFWRRRKFPAPARIQTPDCPACSLVTDCSCNWEDSIVIRPGIFPSKSLKFIVQDWFYHCCNTDRALL